MLTTLRTILSDNWEWRDQTWHLAVTEIQKEVRGSVLGWIWILLTPAIYIGILWLAFGIGLRAGTPVEGVPYVTWLAAGVIPWQFCSRMLTGGSNVYRRYSYLVTRMRFPISVISSFYTLAGLLVFLMTMIIVFIIMVTTGVHFTIYALQFPLVVLLMYLFWMAWSLLTSPLSAFSKDFHNLIKAMSAPLFWLSGVFFHIDSLEAEWMKVLFGFNPVSFFVTGIRAGFCENFWFWEKPLVLFPFLGVFLLTVLLALTVQTRLDTEIADVL